MKRLSSRRLVLLTLLSGLSVAAPRTGTHDGFSRLVFDLPAPSTVTSVLIPAADGHQTFKVSLKVPLPSERGALKVNGVTSYAVKAGVVTVELARGVRRATASVLRAGGGQPARLVIDVPLPPSSAVAAQVLPAVKVAPRPPVVRQAARPLPLTVVLDAGHGGVDSGMVSRWVMEKEVTLDVAQRVRVYLMKRGVNVIMVRTTDTQLSRDKGKDLEARSRLARAGTVNAFVSIHANAGPGSANGIETYYFGQTLNTSVRSLAVFENGGGNLGQQLTRRASSTAANLMGDLLSQAKLAFSAQLARHVQSNLITSTSANDRGVQSDAFYVIQNPTVPAILTEVGFGSSPTEGPKLAQAGYRDRLASALSNGILAFLQVR